MVELEPAELEKCEDISEVSANTICTKAKSDKAGCHVSSKIGNWKRILILQRKLDLSSTPLSRFFAPQLQQNLAAMIADLEAENSKFVLHALRTLQAERNYLA